MADSRFYDSRQVEADEEVGIGPGLPKGGLGPNAQADKEIGSFGHLK